MESVQGRIIASSGGEMSENHPVGASFSSSSTHSDEISTSSEVSQAIPHALIREQWQLVLGQDASMMELQNAIELCRKLVLDYGEGSPERKWIVRHLVELRFRLREIQDVAEDPQGIASASASRVILGHHFGTRQLLNVTTKQFCDHCTGIIWSVVQASYICSDCSFCVHHKCLSSVQRVCAHVVATERKIPIEEICPEEGLSHQKYKCAECHVPLTFNSKFSHEITLTACFRTKPPRVEEIPWTEARQCDYTGLYFCPTCHWNSTTSIPARIVHNWDFTPKRVSRASLQELFLLYDKPVINLEDRNPKLFGFVQKLAHVKKLRTDLYHMKKYLTECRLAMSDKLVDMLPGSRRYLMQNPEMYSVADLVAVESGALHELLNKIYDTFERHIRKCQICSGKGYLCEVCGNNEAIFPFDDCSIPCKKCNSIFHRVCWLRKNQTCSKCVRLEMRRIKDTESDAEDVS